MDILYWWQGSSGIVYMVEKLKLIKQDLYLIRDVFTEQTFLARESALEEVEQ